jgi:hypothetical protein
MTFNKWEKDFACALVVFNNDRRRSMKEISIDLEQQLLFSVAPQV